MKSEHRKFLEFNGRSIYLLKADGTYWVAVKPICEALGVDYNRQFQNLKSDLFSINCLLNSKWLPLTGSSVK